MTITAHIGGAPIEELLFPLLFTGGPVFLLAARLAFTKALRRPATKQT